MTDLPALYEFHGPICPTPQEAYAGWAEKCGKWGVLICGEMIQSEYPEGVSVGHRMEAV